MDVNKDAIKALTDARDLLASGKWTQRAYAKGVNPDTGRNEAVDPEDSRAQCFCSVGALAKVCNVPEYQIHNHIRAHHPQDTPMAVAGRALACVIHPEDAKAIPHGVITSWNDRAKRTLPEVVDKFNEAISTLSK